MDILPIELFGVSVDIPFPLPVGFHAARLEDFGTQLCDPAKGLGLRPEQLRLRRSDELFGYELTGHFFGDNGVLTRTAERVKFSVRHARNAADWNLILETLGRLYALMQFEPSSLTALSTHVHAKCESGRDREEFLGQFLQGQQVIRAAGLGYVRIADWEKEIRVLIEHSNLVPDGLFVAWDTQFANTQDWDTFFVTIPIMMENAANAFSLGFEPLKAPV